MRVPFAPLILLCVLLAGPVARAASFDFFFPNADYDPKQPDFEMVLGYEAGEQITPPDEMLRYLKALEEANPDRMRLVQYATSWQGRPLVYAIISSPENIRRLDQVQKRIARIADPRSLSRDRLPGLIDDLPATVWLSYAVHGDEISTTDAALLTAYHLLASRGDDRVAQMMEEAIVFIDPLQNPDGRARFLHSFQSALGLKPTADRQTAEHDQPWPGGRTNHYLFDLNRDWYILSQPETRGKVAALRDWLPLVFVDAHEMGGDASYYFAPSARPYNPNQPADLREAKAKIGQTIARAFDRRGIDYFTREVFDSFYPGYGDTWPSYYGALSATYEQASARGLRFRKRSGEEMTYADGVRNHFLASLATVEAAVARREALWRGFYDFRRSAIEEGRSEPVRAYLLPTQDNQDGADHLARTLAYQGVEVGRATDAFEACGTRYAPGSYVIDLAQPNKRLVRVLMDTEMPIAADFMAEQERRRAKDLSAQIYDITAWSLPLTFNVQADRCGAGVDADIAPLSGNEPPSGSLTNPEAEVAFLVPWGETGASALLASALQLGLRVSSSDLAFTLDGRRYPRGTLIIPTAGNGPELAKTLDALAQRTGAEVIGVDSSWVSDGPNFGSSNVHRLPAPKIALAWDSPTNPYSAGNTRYVIERRIGYPVGAIRTDQLARADLSGYDVVILPDGGAYGDQTGLADTLRRFAQAGGTVIGIDGGAAFLSHPDSDLMAIRLEDAAKRDDAEAATDADQEGADPRVPGTVLKDAEAYRSALAPGEEAPDRIPGAILAAQSDPDHWASAGMPDTVYALARGRHIFTPAKLDQGVNVLRFKAADKILASGYLWAENREQLAFKPLMVVSPVGDGHFIAITQDIATRAYQPGLDLLLSNAVFRGPAHSRAVR